MRHIPGEIRVNLATHSATGSMIATSPDVPGLYVHGRSKAEIDARIPIAVKALCEADRRLAAERAKKLPEGFSVRDTYKLDLVA